MKILLKTNVLLWALFFVLPGTSMAETAYVTDELQILVRVGKDPNQKPVTVVRSGDKVETIRKDGDWTYVRVGGKEGWMPGRFLKAAPPDKTRLAALEQEHEGQKQRLAQLEGENHTLREENGTLRNTLGEKEALLSGIKPTAPKGGVKDESGNLSSLEEEAGRFRKILEEHTLMVQDLDAKFLEQNLKMFALGAGVLLLGIFLGFSLGRKKKSGYY